MGQRNTESASALSGAWMIIILPITKCPLKRVVVAILGKQQKTKRRSRGYECSGMALRVVVVGSWVESECESKWFLSWFLVCTPILMSGSLPSHLSPVSRISAWTSWPPSRMCATSSTCRISPTIQPWTLTEVIQDHNHSFFSLLHVQYNYTIIVMRRSKLCIIAMRIRLKFVFCVKDQFIVFLFSPQLRSLRV